jgi:hypothetical protein
MKKIMTLASAALIALTLSVPAWSQAGTASTQGKGSAAAKKDEKKSAAKKEAEKPAKKATKKAAPKKDDKK